ncbi:MAG: CRISPR-associated endonuclease Cas2 [Calditrichia bacterium]
MKKKDKYFVVICYDIVKNRKRVKVMKYLKGVGYHVQKSVFEAFLDTVQLKEVKRKIEKIIDLKADSVRFYVIQDNSPVRVHVVGTGEVSQLEDIIIVE